MPSKRLNNLVGWQISQEHSVNCWLEGRRLSSVPSSSFSFILDEIGSSLKDKRFAIIIDEAHSSQNGSLSANLATGISGNATPVVPLKTGSYTYEKDDYPSMVADNSDMTYGDSEDIEDKIHRIIREGRMAKNANYYAFTATPRTKLWKCSVIRWNA